MTDVSETVKPGLRVRLGGGFLKAIEIDLRLFGMVAALAAILIGFGIATNGRFLEPVNLVNLAVQSVSVAIIATGMTLIIVSRNIDLSVGSIVGVVGMVFAQLMARVLPNYIGFDSPAMWIIALVIGLALGALIGALQGFIVAYIGVPSFIVTLGGLLVFRGLTWAVTKGVTISPVDPTFRLLGGGPQGSVGGTVSWIIGIAACVGIFGLLAAKRRQKQRFGFPVRPMWAEVLLGVVSSAAVIAVVWVFNSYLWPDGLARRYAEANGIVVPEGGLRIQSGIPWPVLVLMGVTIVMTFVTTRRRFGRYVFAIGGNPEAAELGGINTRWTVMKAFILIGVLCAISAAIATARLDGSTLDLGEGYELYVIAASVIGGTSFAGGIGTIPGAVLGAIVMASLAYGLSFIGLSSPIQDIVAGIVLVVAVAFDTINRRRKA
jgi:D-xylose transport system permease protein